MWAKNGKKTIKISAMIALGFVCIYGLSSLSANTYALTYQDNVELQFTWNPTIRISLSSADLIIDNLTPGNSADSNTITINVGTNNMYGYTLSATAGNTTNASTNLVNTVDNTKLFTSLATDASLASLTTDNTWGYSYSTNNGTNWSNYSGLPLYTAAAGAELVNNDGSGSTPVQFKIAAKASTIQASGAYTNTINFTAVANPEPTPEPITCDTGKICYSENALDSEGTMADQDIVKAKDWSSCYYTDYESYCSNSNWDEIDINTLPSLTRTQIRILSVHPTSAALAMVLLDGVTSLIMPRTLKLSSMDQMKPLH